MSRKHTERHSTTHVYVPLTNLIKVKKYLKSINQTFSGWVREKIEDLIKEKKL